MKSIIRAIKEWHGSESEELIEGAPSGDGRKDSYPSIAQLGEILTRLNASTNMLREAAESLDWTIDRRMDLRFSKIENRIWRSLFTLIAAGVISGAVLQFCTPYRPIPISPG